MAKRILIADDHEIVLEGIRNLVGRSGRPWIICGEARNGEDAVAMVKSMQPDVAILDITMPNMNGLEAAKEISSMRTECRILIFTMHESNRLGIEAREAGARGLIVKAQAARDLIRAVDALLAGGTFFNFPSEENKTHEAERKPTGLFRRRFAFA
jgi:DNA-binding NarL/FixJ family response regulator